MGLSAGITVAVPLYRSEQFLAILRKNLDSLRSHDLEIIVSDRHMEDSALETLRDAFGEDPRFRFVAATDRLNWVDHFNLLLSEASRRYFFWMFHDDTYSPNFTEKLAAALDANPDAICAYSRLVRIGLDGNPMADPPQPPRRPLQPGLAAAARVLVTRGLQFHGMFRTETLRSRKLWIRQSERTIGADVFWLCAVALVGRILYVDDCCFWKRYYPESTHAQWRMHARYVPSMARVVNSYLDDYCANAAERRAGKAFVAMGAAAWMAGLANTAVARRLKPIILRSLDGKSQASSTL